MPYIGYRVKKKNLPTEVFYSDKANILKDSAAPSTPPTGQAALWWDGTARQWKLKLEDGNILVLSGASPATPAGEANSGSNLGNGGVGVFDSKSGVYLGFRNINAGSSKITVTNDSANKEIDIDLGAHASTHASGGSDPLTGMVSVSSANVFTEAQKVSKNASDLLKLYRPFSTVDSDMGIAFSFNNASSAEAVVALIYAQLKTNTAGSEDAELNIWLKRAGVSNHVFNISKWGKLLLGPDASNQGAVSRNITRSGTPVSLASSSGEQTMFSQTVLGGMLGSNGIVHLKLIGSLLQNQATGTDYTLKIKWGGTIVYQDNIATALAQSAVYLPYMIDVWIYNKNASNSQGIIAKIIINDTASNTTGVGDAGDDEMQVNAVMSGVSQSKDTTADQTLAVTIQMSVNHANAQTNIDYKWLEINPSA